MIRKISGLSGNFLDHLENIQTIRKLSGPSGNFPDGPENSQCNFKGYAQKLSGRAKTFRMAMPQCHQGFWASVVRQQNVSGESELSAHFDLQSFA